VPMAVLMASLMAFGQLSADNEITAVKAGGISLYRITLPVLLVAAGLSVFLIWFNNEVLPDSNHRLRLLARDITIKKPTVNLEPGYLYHDIPNLSIRVDHLVEQQNLSKVKNVLIYDKTDPEMSKTVVAERGDIFVNESTGLLQITLYDGEIHEINNENLAKYTRVQFQKYALTIPIPNMVLQRSESGYRGDREQSAKMMRKEIDNNLELIEKRRQNLVTSIEAQVNRYFSSRASKPVESSLKNSRKEFGDFPERKKINFPDLAEPIATEKPILMKSLIVSMRMKSHLNKQVRVHNNLLQRIKGEQEINRGYELTNNRLLVEIYKKYSIPFACLVFVLIGAPLGIMARRGNMAVGGGISLIFFIIYWIFLIGGEELADRDMLSPFLSMWLANFIVGAFGIYLLIRTAKEASFFNFDFLTRLLPKRFQWKSE
jgi:lipopolysaccharide export system permease protein